MTTIDLSDLSHSYPFLHLACKTRTRYGLILTLASMIDDHPQIERPPPVDHGSNVAGAVWDVCHAPWRWDMSKSMEVGL